MKKKKIISALFLIVIVVVIVVLNMQNEENQNISRREIPQTGIGGVELSPDERVDFMRQAITGTSHVIVGEPTQLIGGYLDIVPFYHGDMTGMMITEYYFRVTEWLYGEPGEEIIRIRSEVGNIFEIGQAYTISVRHINRIIDDQAFYLALNQIWTIPHEEIEREALEEFHEEVRLLPSRDRARSVIIEEVVPTLEFIEAHVDVALIATITESFYRTFTNNFVARIELQEVVYGELPYDITYGVTTRIETTEGNDYLILFSIINDSFVEIVARNGAVIPYGSNEFHRFMELFELASSEE